MKHWPKGKANIYLEDHWKSWDGTTGKADKVTIDWTAPDDRFLEKLTRKQLPGVKYAVSLSGLLLLNL